MPNHGILIYENIVSTTLCIYEFNSYNCVARVYLGGPIAVTMLNEFP